MLQVSDVIDMKEDAMNPTTLTVVLSEERGHVYQFQTPHDLAVFRSAHVVLHDHPGVVPGHEVYPSALPYPRIHSLLIRDRTVAILHSSHYFHRPATYSGE